MMAKSRLMSRGQMEASISDAVTHFEKEYMGRGPLETKTYLVDDMVIVRLKGVLTKAELTLVKGGQGSRGRELIKQVRIELVENARTTLETAVRSIAKRRIRSLHTDVSTTTGEKLIIFVLEKPPDFGS